MEKLIKSPMNYIGGKYKLLPQILDLFPNKINMFYDVFGGGANLSLNVKSEHVYYNDIVPYVSEVLNGMKGINTDECIGKIKEIINTYELSKTNIEGFKRLRDDYNKGRKDWITFYTLMCYSFNNQYRFNNNHEYNSSFGYHKSCFSNVTEQKIKKVIERLDKIDIVFDNKDFRDIDFSDADENDLVYFDPPYLITCGNYNDGKRGFKGWSKQDDRDLMVLCDSWDYRGVRFAMSNVFENKGNKNEELIEWSKEYKIHYINNTYNNSNYQSKDKGKNTTIEVLITNY